MMRIFSIVKIEGLLWVVLGIALCIGSIKLGLGTIHKPGTGFMPFLTGSFLAFVGLILITYQTFFEQTKIEEGNPLTSIKKLWKKGIYSLIVIFLYPLLLEPLGFMIGTFLLLFFLIKIMEPRKWFTPIFISFFTVILSYLVFEVWLRINFPRGIFSIG